MSILKPHHHSISHSISTLKSFAELFVLIAKMRARSTLVSKVIRAIVYNGEASCTNKTHLSGGTCSMKRVGNMIYDQRT